MPLHEQPVHACGQSMDGGFPLRIRWRQKHAIKHAQKSHVCNALPKPNHFASLFVFQPDVPAGAERFRTVQGDGNGAGRREHEVCGCIGVEFKTRASDGIRLGQRKEQASPRRERRDGIRAVRPGRTGTNVKRPAASVS